MIFANLASRLSKASAEVPSEKSSGLLYADSGPASGQTFPHEHSAAAGDTSAAAPTSVAEPTPELAAAAPEQLVPELDDRTKEEKEKDENTFDPNSFSI